MEKQEDKTILDDLCHPYCCMGVRTEHLLHTQNDRSRLLSTNAREGFSLSDIKNTKQMLMSDKKMAAYNSIIKGHVSIP